MLSKPLPESGWKRYGPDEYAGWKEAKELCDKIIAQLGIRPRDVSFIQYEHRSRKFQCIIIELDAQDNPIVRDGQVARKNLEGRLDEDPTASTEEEASQGQP